MFREEVLNARTDRLHGPIMMVRPLSSWILVASSVVIVTCILAYLVLGSYTKRATATGSLLPVNGMVRIVPPVAGVVSERHVEEGQLVHKGDILFILSDERSQVSDGKTHSLRETHTLSLDQRHASLRQARKAAELLAEQTTQGLRNRILMQRDALSRNRQQVDLQQGRVASADRVLQQYRALAKEQFISALALQEKEDAVAAQRAQLLSLQLQSTELKQALVAAEDELRQLPARTEQTMADLDREIGALTQEAAELQTRDRYAITAPMDGVVTSITAQFGQSTNGQALANLLPVSAQLEAHLYLPSKAVGFVEVGQKVRLRYQAYPYQKFGQYGGVVKEVARSPIQVSELPLTLPIASQEGVYRVTVALDTQHITAYDEKIKLRPGMVLEADIEQDSRPLIEWILEPLYSFNKYLS